MVPPKKEKKLMSFCRLCTNYDIEYGKQIKHLKIEHGVVNTEKRDMKSLKEFIFSKVL